MHASSLVPILEEDNEMTWVFFLVDISA